MDTPNRLANHNNQFKPKTKNEKKKKKKNIRIQGKKKKNTGRYVFFFKL